MPDKPKIFISHVTDEGDLAAILEEEIQKSFLGLCGAPLG